MPEWTGPDDKALIKKAADGLELALHLIGQASRPSVDLVYRTPAAALREAADLRDREDQKIAELVRLVNELRDSIK